MRSRTNSDKKRKPSWPSSKKRRRKRQLPQPLRETKEEFGEAPSLLLLVNLLLKPPPNPKLLLHLQRKLLRSQSFQLTRGLTHQSLGRVPLLPSLHLLLKASQLLSPSLTGIILRKNLSLPRRTPVLQGQLRQLQHQPQLLLHLLEDPVEDLLLQEEVVPLLQKEEAHHPLLQELVERLEVVPDLVYPLPEDLFQHLVEVLHLAGLLHQRNLRVVCRLRSS